MTTSASAAISASRFVIRPIPIPAGSALPPPGERVHTVEGREEYRIRFPRVSAVIPDVRDTFEIDLNAVEYIHVDPAHEPTQVVAGAFGLEQADFELWQQDRSEWYAANRV